MKRFFVALYLGFLTVLTLVAQPRFTSNTEMQSVGQVEWKHPLTVQYAISNTGNQPLVLTQVEPDCACTAARWTQTPIAPGEKGMVEVTFDAEALGHFYKSIAVYTNAEPHLVYLNLKGEVVRELKDFTRTHPYQIGSIRIDREELDFPDVRMGEKPVMQVGVVNLSEGPYEPVLMHLPSFLDMEVKPSVLQQGEKGIITLTLHPERLSDWGLTQSSVYLSRFTGDKVGDENEIPVSAILLPDFSLLTESEKQQAPVIRLSAEEVDMSDVLAKKKKARQDIILTNTGHSALQIGKLQVFHPAVEVSLKKNVLMPGESTRLRVTVTKRAIGKKRGALRLLMITNDPAHPKVVISIKAK